MHKYEHLVLNLQMNRHLDYLVIIIQRPKTLIGNQQIFFIVITYFLCYNQHESTTKTFQSCGRVISSCHAGCVNVQPRFSQRVVMSTMPYQVSCPMGLANAQSQPQPCCHVVARQAHAPLGRDLSMCTGMFNFKCTVSTIPNTWSCIGTRVLDVFQYHHASARSARAVCVLQSGLDLSPPHFLVLNIIQFLSKIYVVRPC